MIIKAEKDNLINAITPAMGAVSNTNTISAIEGILFHAEKTESGGNLTLSAYDNEKGMRTSIKADVEKDGGCIINAQKLYQIVRLMPEGKIKISVDNELKTTISGGNSSFELKALPEDMFPALPELSGDEGFSIPQHILKSFIQRTSFAINPNENRAAFRGAFFKIKNDKIIIVTCDGNRLAKCERLCDIKSCNEKEPDFSFIIPGKTLAEFSKIIKDSEDDVIIELARKHVIMRVGDIIYFSRLIDTEYIDYERIIPKSSTVQIYVDSSELRRSLERAALVTEDKMVGSVRSFVKLSLDNSGIMKLYSSSVNGSVTDEIPVYQEGDNIEIGFNCRFLLDVLKVCDPGELKILMSTPMMGISISRSDRGDSQENQDQDDYFFFVMPVRMNN